MTLIYFDIDEGNQSYNGSSVDREQARVPIPVHDLACVQE